MTLKPLGTVKDIVEAAGMAISYAYEDLVFLEHNSFLLQFGEDGREILIHVNEEADTDVVERDIELLRRIAKQWEMDFDRGMSYAVRQEDDDTITIEFSDA